MKKAKRASEILRKDGIFELFKMFHTFTRKKTPLEYKIKYRNKISEIKYGVPTNPLKIYWVDPENIKYSVDSFSRNNNIGTVKKGAWDIKKEQFTESIIYEGLYERFVENQDWINTKYCKYYEKEIQKKGSKWGHSNIDEFIQHRCSYIDQLYHDIKQEGYKTQIKLGGRNIDKKRHKNISDEYIKTHEIGCNIGRSGDLLSNSGNHRLSIAKILNLDRIPIQIIVRHTNWQNIRAIIYNSEKPSHFIEENGISITHPDIQNII